MSDIKVRIRYQFAPVPRELAQNLSVSANTLAVITYLCSKGENWTPRVYDIKKRFGFGDHTWRGISLEMRELGVMELKKTSQGTELIFDPHGIEALEEKVIHTPPVENRTVRKPTRGKSTPLDYIDPILDRSFKKIDHIDHLDHFESQEAELKEAPENAITPQSKSTVSPISDKQKPTQKEIEETFSQFWAIYPLKKAKQAALQAFLKLIRGKPRGEVVNLANAIWLGLNAHVSEHDAKKQIKDQDADIWIPELPHFSTWLNQKRWEDEYKTPEQVLAGATRKKGIIDFAKVLGLKGV